MLKITYTNGDSQTINVTGEFFAITLAEKEGVKVKITPIEKAEMLAFDLAQVRSLLIPDVLVSYLELWYPDAVRPRTRTFRPVDRVEVVEKAIPGPSFIKELKRLKKELRHKKQKQQSLLNLLKQQL